jgi:aminopeptidase N
MYVAPARRQETIRRLADTVLTFAERATPGSDSQFQFLRTFASNASTSEHGEALRQIRSGERSLDGIVVDTDLDWDLLEGMVLAGVASHTDIDIALAADNTANGAQAAARLRATIPTLDGKRAVFELLRDDASLPNALVDHSTRGYLHVNDASVFMPLVDEYFSALETIWETRTYKIAEYFVQGLYPVVLASAELAETTNAWLAAHPDAPSALRRLVIEGLAGVERALTNQARDTAE